MAVARRRRRLAQRRQPADAQNGAPGLPNEFPIRCDGCDTLKGVLDLRQGTLKLENGDAIRFPFTILCRCSRNIRWRKSPEELLRTMVEDYNRRLTGSTGAIDNPDQPE